MLKQIHHKKNEKQEVESFKDKECTKPFDFTNAKNLYIELKDGDISPLTALNDDVRHYANIYIPYIPKNQKPLPDNVLTLDDITPNLSKYIPEDNAVLFLSKEDLKKYEKLFKHQYSYCNTYAVYQNNIARYDRVQQEEEVIIDYDYDKTPITEIQYSKPYPHKTILNDAQREKFNIITIFLPHGTESEIKKANEIVKELMEKYGVKEVNLVTLHWFVKEMYELKQNKNGSYTSVRKYDSINKIITTNSTGILKPEDSNERLQVINCKEIVEEYLTENN